jgi:ATP-binding cassette subfamily B protein
MLDNILKLFRKQKPAAAPPGGRKIPTLRERLQAMRHLPRLFREIWAVSPPMAMANLTLRLFRSAVPVFTLYVGKLIIDEVARLIQQAGPHDFTHLWQLIAIEFGVVLASDILARGIALLDSMQGDLYSRQTSLRLMQHAADMDQARFEDAAFYDKLERARQQTVGRMALMSSAFQHAQDTVTMLFLAVGLVAYNPWLILLLVVTLLPAFFGEAFFNAQSYSLTFARTPERRELDYIRYIGASDESAKEVKIFGLSGFLIKRYDELSTKFFNENKALAVRRAGWGAVLAAISTIGYYAAYVIIIVETARGRQTLGDLTFLVGSFSRLKGLLEGMLNRLTYLAEGALYLRDLYDFFELKPVIQAPANPVPVPKPIRQGFVFENVGFKYENGAQNDERWALRNVSFTLAAGEKLALVGENGSGKTTLVKLLARLYDPTEGRILLDGRDLRDYDLAELRREVGVIFQDFVRYHFTAADNIAVGRIEARADKPRIENAAEKSLANQVVQKLPKGYDQVVGKRFDQGTDLSGGEWQKIALGRAYMRDAQLLILDEPTAALDARAEHQVFQRFVELTQGKTAVLISHRFSTVRMADRILVLDGGQLLELGSHAELLQHNGRYAELFNLQAAGYR